MTDEEYLQAQTTIALVAQMTVDLDLDAFIDRANRAESIAPILDPTLWIRGGKKLEAVKDLAIGLRKFQRAVEKHRDLLGPPERIET